MWVVLILVYVASSSHHTAQYWESRLLEYCMNNGMSGTARKCERVASLCT